MKPTLTLLTALLRVPPARIAAARLHCESLTAAAPHIRRFAVGLTR